MASLKFSFNNLSKDEIKMIMAIDHNVIWSYLCKRTNGYWLSQPRPTLKTIAKYLNFEQQYEWRSPSCMPNWGGRKQPHQLLAQNNLFSLKCPKDRRGPCKTSLTLAQRFQKHWPTIEKFEYQRIRNARPSPIPVAYDVAETRTKRKMMNEPIELERFSHNRDLTICNANTSDVLFANRCMRAPLDYEIFNRMWQYQVPIESSAQKRLVFPLRDDYQICFFPDVELLGVPNINGPSGAWQVIHPWCAPGKSWLCSAYHAHYIFDAVEFDGHDYSNPSPVSVKSVHMLDSEYRFECNWTRNASLDIVEWPVLKNSHILNSFGMHLLPNRPSSNPTIQRLQSLILRIFAMVHSLNGPYESQDDTMRELMEEHSEATKTKGPILDKFFRFKKLEVSPEGLKHPFHIYIFWEYGHCGAFFTDELYIIGKIKRGSNFLRPYGSTISQFCDSLYSMLGKKCLAARWKIKIESEIL